MRKFTLLLTALSFGAIAMNAQTVATFDALTLPGADTCYVNYAHPGTDVGFSDGLAYFPCVYDTGSGSSYWSYGFVYSNKSDTVTSGYSNQYSAKTGSGFGATGKYAVSYGSGNLVHLTGAAMGKPVSGFYVTNNTYAYNSMRDGDAFAKKFGDTTGTGITTGQGTAPDWFKLTVQGYHLGVLQPDSVVFYLADYRPAGTANDSIIRGWHWVNLLPLGHVDSLQFNLSSSDNGMYGMNTPAYFCMDNFTTNETLVGVSKVNSPAARVYPNPAGNILHVDCADNTIRKLAITDVTGKILFAQSIESQHIDVNTSNYTPGIYGLKLWGDNGEATTKFIKQ